MFKRVCEQVGQMKTNDYVKYVTKTIVQYMDQPRSERKQHRFNKKQMKEPFMNKWFGIIPYVVYFLFKRKK